MDNELDEVIIKDKEVRTDSYFDGKFFEYIGYKILAFIITVVSVSIAKPWADKLLIDYKINHTIYNGKRLKFEGKGSSLFVQRLKWLFLSIISLGIYTLWIPIKKEQWIVSNTHFEDEPLVTEESFFNGKLLGFIGVNLLSYILTLVSLGLLFPYTVCYKQRWIASHTIINRKKIAFNGKALSIIGNYILWCLLSIITLGIYGIWLPMKMYGWQVKNTHLKLKDEIEEKNNIIPVVIAVIITIILVIGLISIIPRTNIVDVISGTDPIDITNLIPNFKKSIQKKSLNIEEHSKDDISTEKKIINNSDDSKVTKSKCEKGYIYLEEYNLCYDLNDSKDASTTCDENYDSCGIVCPDGYQISWNIEKGFNGNCYKAMNPNY